MALDEHIFKTRVSRAANMVVETSWLMIREAALTLFTCPPIIRLWELSAWYSTSVPRETQTILNTVSQIIMYAIQEGSLKSTNPWDIVRWLDDLIPNRRRLSP